MEKLPNMHETKSTFSLDVIFICLSLIFSFRFSFFVFAAVDGIVARKWNQTSVFGAWVSRTIIGTITYAQLSKLLNECPKSALRKF